MIVSLIVAMDERGGIGYRSRLPWRLSDDLKRFKSLTMGHHLIMGRKTFESIGKLLPGRMTIVVTRDPAYQTEGAFIVHSLDEALELAEARGEEEAFVVGGGEIFALAIDRAERIYLTLVHTKGRADTSFPIIEEAEWIEVESAYHPADERNQYPTTFKVLERQE